MKKIVSGILAFISLSVSVFAAEALEMKNEEPIITEGFFDLAMLKMDTKTNVIVIDDKAFKNPSAKRTAFTNAIASGDIKKSDISDTKAFIILSGTVDLSDGKVSDKDHSYFDKFDPVTHKKVNKDIVYDIGSNKTIIGVNNAKVAFGGLRIKATAENSAKNVIIRNILFWDAHGSTDYDTSIPEYSSKKAGADQLVIEGIEHKETKDHYDYVPENIWIDHCTFTDGICVDLTRNYNHDGALDAKCVHNMTVSYCEFTNHDKVTLTGSSDKFVTPEERQITFHHNYYHGAVQRMPRSRGCQIHIYNNVYEQIGVDGNSGYSLGPGIASLFIVENNSFGSHKGKILRYADSSQPEDSTFSKLYVSGNVPELNASTAEQFERHKVEDKPFAIYYDYTALPATEVKAIVPTLAGSGKTVVIDGKTY
ncbi:MAG: polysaccharide lyase family 1 protein [Treponema sp.]|nr:polysaccharide lyase family 1 protein [Candidatus Treponema equifaecale]